ncbi:hypothetical protein VTO73DRAFT_6932 [Trametes versicolor]
MSNTHKPSRDEKTTSEHPEIQSPGYTNEGRRDAASDVPANDVGTEGSAPRSDPAASGKVVYAESSYGAGSSGGGDWLEEGMDS